MSLNKIQKIDKYSVEYPKMLKEINDPPQQLYCCGNLSLLKETSVAIVGSRKFTIYGKNVALMLGKHLGEANVNVVSGLAYGIDAFAHKGILDSNGKGIGVLGSGINKMGPKKNYNLMIDLIKNDGLIISEYMPDEPATKYSFPRRNRIISGLSKAVIVVEANFNSGALITAQYANEQGRTVFAVPGNINSQFSMGSNLLIRDGAIPLIVFDDLFKELNIEKKTENKEIENCGEDELVIIKSLDLSVGLSVDRISEITNKNIAEVNALLTVLEIKGIVQSNCGKYYKI